MNRRVFSLVIIFGIIALIFIGGASVYFKFTKSPGPQMQQTQSVERAIPADFYGLNYGHSIGLYWAALPQNVTLFVTVYRSDNMNGPWQRAGRTRVDPWDKNNYFIDKIESKFKDSYYKIEIESDTMTRDQNPPEILETRGPIYVPQWIAREGGATFESLLNTTDWKTFKSKREKFTIKYPASVDIKTETYGGAGPLFDITELSFPNNQVVSIFIGTIKTDLPLEDYIADWMWSYISGGYWQFDPPTRYLVESGSAIGISLTGSKNENNSYHVFVKKNTHVARFDLSPAFVSTDEFRAVVNSLKFN